MTEFGQNALISFLTNIINITFLTLGKKTGLTDGGTDMLSMRLLFTGWMMIHLQVLRHM